ncbi:MAG: tetratricopeptide repeat protein [Candidatus Thorarchaeota archaeon]
MGVRLLSKWVVWSGTKQNESLNFSAESDTQYAVHILGFAQRAFSGNYTILVNDKKITTSKVSGNFVDTISIGHLEAGKGYKLTTELESKKGEWQVTLYLTDRFPNGNVPSRASKERDPLRLISLVAQLKRDRRLHEAKYLLQIMRKKAPTNNMIAQALDELKDVDISFQEHSPEPEYEGIFDPRLLIAAGDNFHREGNYSAAEFAYKQALERDPSNATVWVNLGVALARQGRPKEAENAYRTATELDSKYLLAFNNLGAILIEQERFEEAIIPIEHAISLDKNNHILWHSLGMAFFHLKRHSDAKEAFEKALIIDPRSVPTLISLSLVFRELKEFKRENEVLQQAVALDPTLIQKLKLGALELDDKLVELKEMFAKSQELISLKEFDKAFDILVKATKKFPESGDILGNIKNILPQTRLKEFTYNCPTCNFTSKVQLQPSLGPDVAILQIGIHAKMFAEVPDSIKQVTCGACKTPGGVTISLCLDCFDGFKGVLHEQTSRKNYSYNCDKCNKPLTTRAEKSETQLKQFEELRRRAEVVSIAIQRVDSIFPKFQYERVPISNQSYSLLKEKK